MTHEIKDLNDRWFLEHAVPETPTKDYGTIIYDELCSAQVLELTLVEQKALELEKRGLVQCQEGAGFCWLTKQGWEWLEQHGVDTSFREEGWL